MLTIKKLEDKIVTAATLEIKKVQRNEPFCSVDGKIQ